MMRIIVIGSGGTGGYFGARLAKAGEDVVFVARGAHLEAMRRDGLLIHSAVDGEWRVTVHAVDTLAGEGQADLVLFCVKSFDTESAALLARPVIGPDTGILSIQNGVDNEEKIARLYGADKVMGGVAYIFSNIEAPGVIAHHQLGSIAFGEMDGRRSARAAAFLEACARAGIKAEIVSDIRRTLWEKYVLLAAFAGATAVARLPAKFVREVPALRRFFERLAQELLAVAKAEGVAFDVDMSARATAFLESLAPTNYASLYHDLTQGKRLEVEALHGHALRLAEKHKIETPMLFAVYAALVAYADGAPRAGGEDLSGSS